MLENTKNNINLAAGIDIGSNSLRLIIGEVSNGKIVNITNTYRENTRLAQGLKETGQLAEINIANSITALKKFKEVIDSYNIYKVKTFATSAVREASNAEYFINKAKEIGINIEIISGTKEAHLTLLGVSSGLNLIGRPLIFDIGGGSTELMIIEEKKISFIESYNIGVIKLADIFDLYSDNEHNIQTCKNYVKKFFDNIKIPKNCDKLIATAGTATTLAAIDLNLSTYSSKKINGHQLTKEKVINIFNKIISTPLKERTKIIGLEKGREDVIIPGIIILLVIMDITEFNLVTTTGFGLKEGALMTASMEQTKNSTDK